MVKTRILIIACMILIGAKGKDDITIYLLPGEKIWSGAIKEGHKMPFENGYIFDFYANNQYNQIQPLLLSDKGLWVWSEEPFAFEIQQGKIIITRALGEIESGRAGVSLAEARKYAADRFFPASGKMPEELLFSKPQYNTWIELTYYHTQADVLKYAKGILDNGFPPGVLMIDAGWQEDYGMWKFHAGRFPAPKKMIDKLHQDGFKVMLWVCPFISADQALLVRELMKEKALLLHKTDTQTTWESATEPAIIKWWDGYSALLDFTNPAAEKWFNDQLSQLVKEYQIDGFKLDAGDMDFYPPYALSMKPATPNLHCELYARIGLKFPLNEYRACWKLGGQPLVQRLHDKLHSWEDVQKLIPHMLTEGLAGYTFSCPDMIGGGDYTSFLDNPKMDQDLVVRSAQIHALMPMMQFSVAPWRILDSKHLDAIKKTIEIRKNNTPKIIELARESAINGEPIVSSLEYCFPGKGYEKIMDQFMLGKTILVAPMTESGKTQRTVVLPSGKWTDETGMKYNGGKTYIIEVPLDRIPVFTLSN